MSTVQERDTVNSSVYDRYLHLIDFILNKIRFSGGPYLSRDDLLGLGFAGLVEAFRKFNRNREIEFSTFATYRIRGAIIDGLRDADFLKRSEREAFKEGQALMEQLIFRLGRQPSRAEAEEEFRQNAVDPIYLELEDLTELSIDVENEDGLKLVDSIRSTDPLPEECVLGDEEIREQNQKLKKAKDIIIEAAGHALTKSELKIFLRHFLDGIKLPDVAIEMEISPSYVYLIARKARKKVYDYLTAQGYTIDDFI